MDIVLNGVYNFLNYVNNNWTMIFAIVVVAFGIWKKIEDYLSKSKEEQEEIKKQQLEIAKKQIKEIMLRLVTEAECDYYEWLKAGAIKRAQVIDQIFAMYPILSQVTNQEEIIKWIDDTIKEALEDMREIFEENEAAAKAAE